MIALRRSVSPQHIISILRSWARQFVKKSAFDEIFLFGSLLHQDGAQFRSQQSDIDLILRFDESTTDPIGRVKACQAAIEPKRSLEKNLKVALGRKARNLSVVSAVPVTSFECENDIHKERDARFYSVNNFLALSELRGKPQPLASSASTRLAVVCADFMPAMCSAQYYRHKFLSSARGHSGLPDYKHLEPIPKPLARAAAQMRYSVRNLSDDSQFDIVTGTDYLYGLVSDWRSCGSEYVELHRLFTSRRVHGAVHKPINSFNQLLLWEILAEAGVSHVREEQDKALVRPVKVRSVNDSQRRTRGVVVLKDKRRFLQQSANLVDDYRTLQQRLLSRGIRPATDLASARTQKQLQVRFVMGDILVDGDFAGFAGVRPQQTCVTMIEGLTPLLPLNVRLAKRRVKEPAPNKPKVFLVDWEPPVIDTGANLKLKLCASDYWTSLALEDVRGELKRDILEGKLALKSLPRRLNIAIVIVTADLKLVLCRRAGPQQTRYYADTWSVVGETMDAKEDRDQAGEIRPEKTVLRALTEFDELNLPHDVAEDAEIRFLAMTTNWEYLLADMIALVKLRTKDFRFVRDCWSSGEHTALGYAAFSVDQCLRLIAAGHYAPVATPQLRAPLNGWSRTAILAALFSEFSYHRVLGHI
jgi:predicted nucleotidyltransferase